MATPLELIRKSMAVVKRSREERALALPENELKQVDVQPMFLAAKNNVVPLRCTRNSAVSFFSTSEMDLR